MFTNKDKHSLKLVLSNKNPNTHYSLITFINHYETK